MLSNPYTELAQYTDAPPVGTQGVTRNKSRSGRQTPYGTLNGQNYASQTKSDAFGHPRMSTFCQIATSCSVRSLKQECLLGETLQRKANTKNVASAGVDGRM
jgi:hypothetical protein